MASGMFKVDINEELIKQLERIPVTLRSGPLPRCLSEFGKPLAKGSVPLARSSRRSGTRLKWSKKYRDNPAYQVDSGKHFGVKVPKHGLAVIVGAKYDKGNKQQFNMPYKKGDSYEHVLWGKRVGRTIRFPMQDRAPVRSFHTRKSEASAQFLRQLDKELKELKLG
jgi:hypothetical protein